MTSPMVFVFGRTPALAFAELRYLFPHSSIDLVHPRVAIASIDGDPELLIKRLGGTVRIGTVIAEESSVTPDRIAAYLARSNPRSITFALSHLGDHPLPQSFSREVKDALKTQGISPRYIFNPNNEPLSAVIMRDQRVTEYLFIPRGEATMIVQTIASQDVDAWSVRDFGRPRADAKRGMLPPKVARMIVNIASFAKQDVQHPTLLDPFCGMGTILAEAMLEGWRVIGADIVREVVNNAQENLRWIGQKYGVSPETYQVYHADATHIADILQEGSVDAIVTEPFLGDPSLALVDQHDLKKVQNMLKGLEKLYIGCLKEWKTVIKPHGIIIMAFPLVVVHDHELTVKKVIDRCERLGYSVEDGPWIYARPQAFVKRAFYLFRSA